MCICYFGSRDPTRPSARSQFLLEGHGTDLEIYQPASPSFSYFGDVEIPARQTYWGLDLGQGFVSYLPCVHTQLSLPGSREGRYREEVETLSRKG